MTASIIDIIVIIILVILSGFFSSSETALTAITPHRLRNMLDDGVKNADILNKVLSKKSRMLSVILICNNIVNLTASALMTVLFQRLFGEAYVSIGTGVLTLIILIFGEVSPKTMATYRAERLSLLFARPVWWLMVVLTPLAFVIDLIAAGVLKLLKVDRNSGRTITESELRTIVSVSQEEGLIENEEKKFINNVFDFSDTTVKEIMVPRIDIVFISLDAAYDEIKEIFFRDKFTRLPVLGDDEKVVGAVNIKDLAFLSDKEIEGFKVENYLRTIEFTFEKKNVLDLLREMKETEANMSIVLDEYGDTAGLVTLEDLLEELVGDIRDEYDADERKEIEKTAENTYSIEGHVSIDDVNDKLLTNLDSRDYDSIGGLLIELLGKLPCEGDCAEYGNVEITAESVNKNRIEKVTLKIKTADEG